MSGAALTCFCCRSITESLKSAPSILAFPKSERVSTARTSNASFKLASFKTCKKAAPASTRRFVGVARRTGQVPHRLILPVQSSIRRLLYTSN